MAQDIRDITIIGGGPTGLYAAFHAGMREMSTRIIDSLPELGGQLMALYPEKYIYDVGGFPRILAKELAAALIEQALQFEPDVVLDEEVQTITTGPDGLILQARNERFVTRTLVLAGGKGAFEPTKLKRPGYDEFLGKGVYYAVKDPETFRGKRVLIVGGGDSALDWALSLKDLAADLLLIHRRDHFRAHQRTVAQLADASAAGELAFRSFHEVKEIRGADAVESVVIFDNRSGEEEAVEVDAVLTFLGFKPDLGPIKSWGLESERGRVKVSRLMETSVPRVYAAGDLVDYEGKLDLIATGFAEAAVAVNHALHYVNPGARVTPGHSTSMKIFTEK
ncbi:NAD(P)/FAD-dependent oxidoreductase [Gemmatimonadota bacterium]